MLTGLRRLWGGFVLTAIVLAGAAAALANADSTVPWPLPVGLVLAVGLAAAVGVVAVERALHDTRPRSQADARDAVRSRLAIQGVLAEAPVLLACAMAFALGPGWVALVGGGAGVATLLLARPTSPRLQRLEHSWRDAGADVTTLTADTGG